MYDINLSENMPGTLSEDRYKRFWSKNEGQVVNAISFYNSGIASEIKKSQFITRSQYQSYRQATQALPAKF